MMELHLCLAQPKTAFGVEHSAARPMELTMGVPRRERIETLVVRKPSLLELRRLIRRSNSLV